MKAEADMCEAQAASILHLADRAGLKQLGNWSRHIKSISTV